MTLEGILHHEVSVPGSWNKVEKDDPMSFEGADKNEIFESRCKWEGRAFRGTCNGLVPSFEFNDKDIEAEYNQWYKNLSYCASFSMFYDGGIVD